MNPIEQKRPLNKIAVFCIAVFPLVTPIPYMGFEQNGILGFMGYYAILLVASLAGGREHTLEDGTVMGAIWRKRKKT